MFHIRGPGVPMVRSPLHMLFHLSRTAWFPCSYPSHKKAPSFVLTVLDPDLRSSTQATNKPSDSDCFLMFYPYCSSIFSGAYWLLHRNPPMAGLSSENVLTPQIS